MKTYSEAPMIDLKLEISIVEKDTVSIRASLVHKDLPFDFTRYTDSKEQLNATINKLYERVLWWSENGKAEKVCSNGCYGNTVYVPGWDKEKSMWYVLKCSDTPIYYSKNLPSTEAGYDCCKKDDA